MRTYNVVFFGRYGNAKEKMQMVVDISVEEDILIEKDKLNEYVLAEAKKFYGDNAEVFEIISMVTPKAPEEIIAEEVFDEISYIKRRIKRERSYILGYNRDIKLSLKGIIESLSEIERYKEELKDLRKERRGR